MKLIHTQDKAMMINVAIISHLFVAPLEDDSGQYVLNAELNNANCAGYELGEYRSENDAIKDMEKIAGFMTNSSSGIFRVD